MEFVLLALSAAVAVAVELLEAMAIVLAVGTTRRWPDALLGAAGGALACAVLAAALSPVLSSIDIDLLRVVIGSALLWFGLNWLRKNTLRLAGRRSRASSAADYDETVAELAGEPAGTGGPDWVARLVAFKGVLLEGVEVVLIVSALAARPGGATPAILGAVLAAVLVLSAGAWLRAPLSRLPETELKWGVGVMLTSFGAFFAGEGLGVSWPGDNLSVLFIAVCLALGSLAVSRRLRLDA